VHTCVLVIGDSCLTFFQIREEPLANVQLPVTHLCALRSSSTSAVDTLIAGGNFNSLVILNGGKVCFHRWFVMPSYRNTAVFMISCQLSVVK